MSRSELADRRLAFHRRLNIGALCVGMILLGGWLGQAPDDQEVLRVRGLIVEDSLGRARIVLGAPLPLEGDEGRAGGHGIAVLSPEGRFSVAMGSPTPSPVIEGEVTQRVVGESSGIVFFDTAGNERGGMGTYADGRANVCLDYAGGVKEAACMFVYPNDQYAGLLVHGPGDQGLERAVVVVGADGLARMKISGVDGLERAMLQTRGNGTAELLVHDSISGEYVDILGGR